MANDKKDRQYETDLSQIAFISNRKTLIAACDFLQPANVEDGDPDKCPASLHARYSRIKINVTNFDANPTVYLTFNLEPADIRMLHEKIKMLSMTERDFEWSQVKDLSKLGTKRTETFSLKRATKRGDDKSKYPWTVTIAHKEGDNKKFASKLLADDEIFKFFGDVVAYLNVWEMTFGAPFIRTVIEPYKREREERYKQSRQGKGGKGPSGSRQDNAPAQQRQPQQQSHITPDAYAQFGDAPL